MAGVPTRTLQERMGHRDMSTTERYADYAPSVHEAAMIERAWSPQDFSSDRGDDNRPISAGMFPTATVDPRPTASPHPISPYPCSIDRNRTRSCSSSQSERIERDRGMSQPRDRFGRWQRRPRGRCPTPPPCSRSRHASTRTRARAAQPHRQPGQPGATGARRATLAIECGAARAWR
jgi:hypothetical protein